MQKASIDGKALVYCDGAFNTPNGKTAHGLVRFTERYQVVGVIDKTHAGEDAGKILDGRDNGIPIFRTIENAEKKLLEKGHVPRTLVIGIAPDGGRLPAAAQSGVSKVSGRATPYVSTVHAPRPASQSVSVMLC